MTTEKALSLAPGESARVDIYEADFKCRQRFVREILQRKFTHLWLFLGIVDNRLRIIAFFTF